MEQKYIYYFTAMTTPCEVILYADIKVKADTVAQDILKEVKRLEKKYNYYDDTSFLSQINLRHINELDVEKTPLSTQLLETTDTDRAVEDGNDFDIICENTPSSI